MASADFYTFSAAFQQRLLLSERTAQISPGTTRFFPSIYLPYLPYMIPCSYWALTCCAVLPSCIAFYMISVRQTRGLPIGYFFSQYPASFRFHLTMDTLAFGYILPTTGRISVGSSDGAVVSVSIACHLKPCMRFSLTRLSDNLLPAAFKGLSHIFSYLDDKSTLFHC